MRRMKSLAKNIYNRKGRCNVTNGCDVEELFEHIVTNKKFMYSSIYTFDNVRVQEFLKMQDVLSRQKEETGFFLYPINPMT